MVLEGFQEFLVVNVLTKLCLDICYINNLTIFQAFVGTKLAKTMTTTPVYNHGRVPSSQELLVAAKMQQRQRLSIGLALLPRTFGMTSNVAQHRQRTAAAVLKEHSDFISSLLLAEEQERVRREHMAHLQIPRIAQGLLFTAAPSSAAGTDKSTSAGQPCSVVSNVVATSTASPRPVSPLSSMKEDVPSNSEPLVLNSKKDTKWLGTFEELKAYKTEHGDCIVPRGYVENPKLASWVAEQRKQYKLMKDGKQSSISSNRIKLLEGIGFAWNAQEAAWMRRLTDLKRFWNENGHGNVSLNDLQYPKLGLWIKEQRRHYSLMKQGKPTHMTDERVAHLESIGFCWDTHESTWQERLRELAEFKDRFGSCVVPTTYKENPKLGTWVHHQRRQYKRAREGKASHMTQDRIKALDGLGFVWYPRDNKPLPNTISDASSVVSESDLESVHSFEPPARKKQRTASYLSPSSC